MRRDDPIHSEDDLAPFLEAWDELAQRCRMPYASPAWSLAWWRHLAPPGARLHVVALPDGSELRGLAAAYVPAELLPRGRFRLWSMEVDGEPISSHLFVCGGGRADHWLGGFDGAWARYSPAMVTLLEGVRHAFEEGDTEIGLGSGRQAYKARFAADLDGFEWHTLVPARSFASPWVWTGVVPRLLPRAVSDRMPPATTTRLKSVAGRGDTSDV